MGNSDPVSEGRILLAWAICLLTIRGQSAIVHPRWSVGSDGAGVGVGMRRLLGGLAGLAVVLAVVGCGRGSDGGSIAAGAGPGTVVSTSTTSTTSTSVSSTTGTVPGPTTTDDARPRVVAAFSSRGESAAFANCVVDSVARTLSLSDQRLAWAVLSLGAVKDDDMRQAVAGAQAPADAVADLPAKLFAIEDGCRSVGVTGTSAPLPAPVSTPSSIGRMG